ncbi:phage replisome organizer N-terminal domain-containing protein [Peribacillus muralis]|uniref:phage replisome organizer N-terminal domain-containing protein n=1 Tax=Peribacillus muralis TaxID=264697 RepID=UPI003D03D392
MAEIKWIKLSTSMFDDEKIRLIQAMPESDAIIVIWVRLLTLAGKNNADGQIYISENMPYNEEMFATLFNKPINTIRLAIETLKKFCMIDVFENGTIFVNNWEKHQNLEGMDKIKVQNAERARKYREKKKMKQLENSHVISRDSHALDIEEDIDKERDIDREESKEKFSSLYQKIIAYLNQKTGKRFSHKSEANKKLINGRMSEGRTVEDFVHVIDVKCSQWMDDPKMNEYLRPSTLFAQKNFENYVNEKPKLEKKKSLDPRDKDIEFQRWIAEGNDPDEFTWN